MGGQSPRKEQFENERRFGVVKDHKSTAETNFGRKLQRGGPGKKTKGPSAQTKRRGKQGKRPESKKGPKSCAQNLKKGKRYRKGERKRIGGSKGSKAVRTKKNQHW